MKKKISIRCSSLLISWWRMILVFGVLLFAFQSTLHAQIERGSFDFDGRLRNYMVYLPTNYTGIVNFPLVICLHPYGKTAEWMMNYANMNQVADASDFIVVYPSGIPNWNSGIGDLPGYTTPNADDVGFINALIDIMSNRYCIDLERIYSCGYSNGGCMSYKLACQLSNRIAAIASVGSAFSPSTAESCSPLRTMPVLNISGTADPYVQIPHVDETLSYWINFNDCVQIDTIMLPDLDPTDGCTVEKITYTNCSDNNNVVYYKVINGGHTWPGADPIPAFGNTNQDFDASVEIWNFFKNYTLIVPPVVDFNGDGIVDSLDVCIMIDHWGTDDPMCDIAPPPYGDGIVDVQDLIILAEHLFEEIFPPELVAYWKMDEAEGDISYNSISDNHGVLSGNPTWQPDCGQVAGALQFDGIDDYISTNFVLNPAEGSFSVLAWIKDGAPGQVIISQPSGSDWLALDAEGNLMTGLNGLGQSSAPLFSEAAVTDGQWHHIGLVWDGSRRMLGVDGVIAAEDTQDGLGDSGNSLYIGVGKDYAAGTYFSGLIDDVRIYNRAVHP